MSSSGVFGPPPPGVDLSETQNGSIVKAVVSLMVIGTAAVVLRVIARTKQKGVSMAIDDYLVILGLLFAHGTAICCLVSLPYGGGKHLWVLTAEQFTTIWQILFAYVIIYATAVSFTKLSIVMFYQRIFGITWSLYICLFLVLSYWITITITIIVGCQPLQYFWTQYTTPGATGHCIDVPLFFFANGIWAMLVDVCILIVPFPIVFKLKMPRSQKIAVTGVLLLGSFVCVASIIRIITIHHLTKSVDLTWAMADVFIWSCCEPFIGIVCACLPTLTPFFRRWWAAVRTRRNGSSGTPIPDLSGKNASVTRSTDLENGSQSNSGGRVEVIRESFRKNKREWNRIHDNVALRNDDEVQLTTDITGPGSTMSKASNEDIHAYAMKDIVVKKDVSWSSSRLVNGSEESN